MTAGYLSRMSAQRADEQNSVPDEKLEEFNVHDAIVAAIGVTENGGQFEEEPEQV